MNKKWIFIIGLLIVLGGIGYAVFKKEIGSVSVPGNAPAPTESVVTDFTLPEGYEMNVFARGVEGARVMLFDSRARMLVSQGGEGSIMVLTDANSDGVAEEQKVLVENLTHPHGMALQCNPVGNLPCHLYVAQADELTRYTYDEATATLSDAATLLDFEYSATDNHKTRTLLMHDDSTLLISVGSTCNVCTEKGEQAGKILAYNIETKVLSDYATGLRNSVFMTRSPVDGRVWATEMGRDGLGDNTPPDEINVITKGGNYGWPVCYGNNIHDTNFDKNVYIQNPCNGKIAPKVALQAHSAPLGLTFIPEEGWPQEYWYNLLVAYHGSWNRSVPTGYKIVRIVLDAKGNYKGTEDFITGWLRPDGKKIGRPADVMAMPGGTIYISDDQAGIVYRVSATSIAR
ncbi:MAG TPA: PQQ-dependent sugar dehydrogenase [Candidatus Paceibacterota bacterium]